MMDPNDIYLTGMTINQVAKALGISPASVYVLARSGKIESVQSCHGGTWLTNPESVKTYKKYLDAKRMVEQHKYI